MRWHLLCLSQPEIPSEELVGWSSPEQRDKLCTCAVGSALYFFPFAKACPDWNHALCLNRGLKKRDLRGRVPPNIFV